MWIFIRYFCNKEAETCWYLGGSQTNYILSLDSQYWPLPSQQINDSWNKSAHRGKQIAIKPVSKKQICMETVIFGLKPDFIGIGLETFVSSSPFTICTLLIPPLSHFLFMTHLTFKWHCFFILKYRSSFLFELPDKWQ